MTSVRESPPTPDQAATRAQLLDLLAGFMRTQALSVATKLGLPDLVSTEPMDVAELASRVGAHESSLYRLMRYLATEGVFCEVEPRRFTESRLSNGLRTDTPITARWQAIMLGSEHYRCWGDAMHSFLSGEPAFERVYGRPFFDYLAENRELGETFDRAMAAATPGRVGPLVAYDWTGVDHIADIGGGTGTALAGLLSAHPHLKGVLVDLPSVAEAADGVLRAAGVRDRCEIVGADFFADRLPPADAYVLSRILHDWDDGRAAAILRNCRRSLDDSARLLLVEGVVPDGPDPDFRKLFDLHMLVLIGGKERTGSEWRALLEDAGFEVSQMSDGLIEARTA